MINRLSVPPWLWLISSCCVSSPRYTHDTRSRNLRLISPLFSGAGFRCRFFVPYWLMSAIKISSTDNKHSWKRRRGWISGYIIPGIVAKGNVNSIRNKSWTWSYPLILDQSVIYLQCHLSVLVIIMLLYLDLATVMLLRKLTQTHIFTARQHSLLCRTLY